MMRRQPHGVERPVGDPSASYVDKNGNLPGHSPILAVVNQQFRAPELSTAARVFGYSPLAEDSRPFFDAAVSDAEVGVALARMGEEWTAFHSFPVRAEEPRVRAARQD